MEGDGGDRIVDWFVQSHLTREHKQEKNLTDYQLCLFQLSGTIPAHHRPLGLQSMPDGSVDKFA
jgi:hypothetical protein